MARRNDHNRDELFAMCLSAAQDIVDADGYKALTIRKLADRIQYSVGTIYNLFDNQDALVVTLNAQTLDRMNDVLGACLEQHDPRTDNVEDGLIALANAYITFTETQANLWNCLFDHRLPEGATLPMTYLEKITTLLAHVEAVLAPLFAAESLAVRRQAARILWSSLHGICSLSVNQKLDIITEETAMNLSETMIRHFMTGLRQKIA